MSQINLLPWRALQKRQQQQRFLGLLALVSLLMLGLLWAISSGIAQQTTLQQQVNQTLTQQITALQQQLHASKTVGLARNQLATRIELIAYYQQQRNLSVWLFNQLATLVPDTVSLQRLSLAEQRIQLSGHTRDASALAAMLRKFEQIPALQQARLVSLISEEPPLQASSSLAQFSLQVAINPEAELLPWQTQP